MKRVLAALERKKKSFQGRLFIAGCDFAVQIIKDCTFEEQNATDSIVN